MRLMCRPLYWLGKGSQPTLNTTVSLADPPTYKKGPRRPLALNAAFALAMLNGWRSIGPTVGLLKVTSA